MRQLMMMAAASGAVLGAADTLIRLTPLDAPLHWHAILIAFVIMPALIVGLTRRLKEGTAPLVAALVLSAGHFLGMAASHTLIHGFFWDDLLVVPLMTLPILLLTATLVRLKTRQKAAPAKVAGAAMPTFEEARERARQRRKQQRSSR